MRSFLCIIIEAEFYKQFRTDSLISTLCADYRDGRLSGNLCESVCENKSSVSDYHQGATKRVLRVKLSNGTDITLKATHDFFNEYESIDAAIDEEELTEKVRFYLLK